MYGVIPIPKPETGLKLDNGKIREMTPEERKAAGLKKKLKVHELVLLLSQFGEMLKSLVGLK